MKRLPGRQAALIIATTGKQELPRLSAGQPQILVDGLPRLIRQLEPTGLPVFFCRTVARSIE